MIRVRRARKQAIAARRKPPTHMPFERVTGFMTTASTDLEYVARKHKRATARKEQRCGSADSASGAIVCSARPALRARRSSRRLITLAFSAWPSARCTLRIGGFP